MKINFDKMNIGIKIWNLKCGDTFIAKRIKPHENETALYMIIDKSSGVFKATVSEKVCTLNLSTGQIRLFNTDTYVTPINAEVIVS